MHPTEKILFHRGGVRSLLGALAYLGFDALVLPLAAGIGAVGGILGMLIVYGVRDDRTVAAVVIYEAVGLLVPLLGGASSRDVTARCRP